MPDLNRLDKLRKEHRDYLYRLELNTFVLESFNVVYMDTPKTGGTSLKTVLAAMEGEYNPPEDSLSDETSAEMFIHDRAINPLKPVTHFPDQLQEEILFSKDWKRFCVVRNPYSRLFSAWLSKLLLRQPGYLESVPGYALPDTIGDRDEVYAAFQDFVEYLARHGTNSNPHWDRQTNLLFAGSIEWDEILKFETLQVDLERANQLFGGQRMVLDRLNVSGFAPDWGAVPAETKDQIKSIYIDDFEAFGYEPSPPLDEGTLDILPVYVNSVVARNKRIATLIKRSTDQASVIADQRGEISTLEQTNSSQAQRLEQAEKQLAMMAQNLHDLENSRSWKLTAPLRRLKKLVSP
jgi:hypothetical protein